MENVIYFKKINSIGGVESWLYYLAKKYDFKFYYKEANAEQIKRLSQYVEVHKYKEPIKCDKFFCNYGFDIEVEAKEKYEMIHCDFKQVDFKPLVYDGFKYIGVSQLACDSFTELTGKECDLMYNPIEIDIPKVEKYNDGKLHLISATRLTKEKGLERMQKLAKMLDNAGIEYEWVVYSNRHRQVIGKNVIYKDPKLNIIEEIAKADYLVQLSDCESYCYSVVESLMVGTPVIVTDLPVFKELGIEHGKNAIICDLDMKQVDLYLIKEKMLKTGYKPPISDWNKYLSNKKTYNPNELVKVHTTKRIYDVVLNKHYAKNQEIEITKARASELEAKGLVEW